MSKGYVYILTNEAMPGLVKIGKTTRGVEQRAAELTHTGIPFPFDVFGHVHSPDCAELEDWIHRSLADCRVNQGREFFLCAPDVALETLEGLHIEQVSLWLDEFLPGYSFERSDHMVDPSVPMIMATHFAGLTADDIVDAYGFMFPDDIQGALRRREDHYSGKSKMKWLKPRSEVEP